MNVSAVVRKWMCVVWSANECMCCSLPGNIYDVIIGGFYVSNDHLLAEKGSTKPKNQLPAFGPFLVLSIQSLNLWIVFVFVFVLFFVLFFKCFFFISLFFTFLFIYFLVVVFFYNNSQIFSDSTIRKLVGWLVDWLFSIFNGISTFIGNQLPSHPCI